MRDHTHELTCYLQYAAGTIRAGEVCATIFNGPNTADTGTDFILGDNWISAYPSVHIAPTVATPPARSTTAQICFFGTVRVIPFPLCIGALTGLTVGSIPLNFLQRKQRKGSHHSGPEINGGNHKKHCALLDNRASLTWQQHLVEGIGDADMA